MAQPQAVPIPLAEIEAAAQRIHSLIVRTPLIRLQQNKATDSNIYLKLENLQPIGAYKLRGAANKLLLAAPAAVADGVWTASSGNMGRAVAWMARRFGVPCTVVMPDFTPQVKKEILKAAGARVISIPTADWFEVLQARRYPGVPGLFVHPASDPEVMAGHGTMGLEIFADLPAVDTVIFPYGGGGLTTGVGSALRALKPDIRIFACEPVTAAPLSAALAAGRPQTVPMAPSFVDAIGSSSVLPEMWPTVRKLVDGAIPVQISAVAEAVRLLARECRIIAEGAGAAPLAAALAADLPGNTVCIVSGGNIDLNKFIRILAGETPES